MSLMNSVTDERMCLLSMALVSQCVTAQFILPFLLEKEKGGKAVKM